MIIRKYPPADASSTYAPFCDTVHKVNAADYTPEQLSAWADGLKDIGEWNTSLMANAAYVAEEGGRIVGFGDISSDGYLDRLYVAADCQRRGIATALCNILEQPFSRIEVHASVTAKPFFERRGYVAISPNTVVRKGVELTNYIMVKTK